MKFALIVEYITGKAVMLTDVYDLKLALEKFYKELEKAFPYTNYKDFSLPAVTSCELVPVKYNSHKSGKMFALITQYKTGKSAMTTDATDILMALFKLKKERQKENPADRSGSGALIDITSCELLPVLYENKF